MYREEKDSEQSSAHIQQHGTKKSDNAIIFMWKKSNLRIGLMGEFLFLADDLMVYIDSRKYVMRYWII